jgi:hypothetical protein
MHTPEKNPSDGRTTETDRGVTIGKKVDRGSDTAHQAWTQTRGAFSDLTDALDIQGRLKRHPYGTVAAALGIGYVLGGGIFTKLTSRIVGLGLRIGVRAAVLPLLKDQIAGLAESWTDGPAGAERESGKGHKGGKRT